CGEPDDPGPDEDRTNPVAVTTAEELAANPIPADLVLIAVKAGGLDQVIDDIRPAIGPDTLIIPFLNGMAHIDRLDREFPGQVLGGIVKIICTKPSRGAVLMPLLRRAVRCHAQK
ncbi:hypothetical protein KCW65_22365, partial [Mycobacterium tuberculosis]|nr:hypothetical protein [Mycobacterium tuberculosis]